MRTSEQLVKLHSHDVTLFFHIGRCHIWFTVFMSVVFSDIKVLVIATQLMNYHVLLVPQLYRDNCWHYTVLANV